MVRSRRSIRIADAFGGAEYDLNRLALIGALLRLRFGESSLGGSFFFIVVRLDDIVFIETHPSLSGISSRRRRSDIPPRLRRGVAKH